QNPFLPHFYPHGCIAYTGTHDNSPILAWYAEASAQEKSTVNQYVHPIGEDLSGAILKSLWESPAAIVFAQMQDFLELGGEARMNYPGTPEGNWVWRMGEYALSELLMKKIKRLNVKYNRARPKR
ncbi:MAG: 4-alpha-glucanotransferase, partial [Chloroflexota bacterium]